MGLRLKSAVLLIVAVAMTVIFQNCGPASEFRGPAAGGEPYEGVTNDPIDTHSGFPDFQLPTSCVAGDNSYGIQKLSYSNLNGTLKGEIIIAEQQFAFAVDTKGNPLQAVPLINGVVLVSIQLPTPEAAELMLTATNGNVKLPLACKMP